MALSVLLTLGLTATAAAVELPPARAEHGAHAVALADARASIFRFERPGDESPREVHQRQTRRERDGLIVDYP